MAPVSMIGAFAALLFFGLLTGAAVAWCLTLYHLLMLLWRHSQARGAGALPAGGAGTSLWSAPDLPPSVSRHRERVFRSLRLFGGCLLGALLMHGLGELVTWVAGWFAPPA